MPKTIQVLYLPPPPHLADVPSDADPSFFVTAAMTRAVPALRDSLKLLTESTRLVALVVDIVGTDAFEVAREFNLLRYIFVPLCAMTLSSFLHLPKFRRRSSRYHLADGIIVNSFLELEPGAFNAFVEDEEGGSGKKLPVSPAKDGASGVHYNAQSINKDDDPFDFLPKGFMERTRRGGLGLLVRSWAP
ncbi:hypothetical protein ACSBR1_030662 [Camellia fascicularis]